MTTEESKETVRRFISILSSRDLSQLDEICDENMVYRVNTEAAATDLETHKGLVQKSFDSFPDVEFFIEEIFAEGDKVLMIYKMVGTHKSEYIGIPASNNKIEHTASAVVTLENGSIIEQHDFYDMLAFLMQLGAVSEEVRPGGKDWPVGGAKLRAQ